MITLKNRAEDFSKKKSTEKIYKGLSILIGILAVVTSIASVYASKGLIQTIIEPLLREFSWFSNGLSWSLTILLEIITISSLYTTLYLYFVEGKAKINEFYAIGLLALSFYGLNFYLSTNGLQERSIDAIDNTIAFNAQFKQDSLKVYSLYTTKIDSLILANSDLNKKAITQSNFNQMEFNRELILKYENDFDNEKKRLNSVLQDFQASNNTNKQKAGEKSYLLFAIVQIIQILLHVLLAKLYTKVYEENKTPEQERKEQEKELLEMQRQIKRAGHNAKKATINSITKDIERLTKNTDINSIVETEEKTNLNSAYSNNLESIIDSTPPPLVMDQYEKKKMI